MVKPYTSKRYEKKTKKGNNYYYRFGTHRDGTKWTTIMFHNEFKYKNGSKKGKIGQVYNTITKETKFS